MTAVAHSSHPHVGEMLRSWRQRRSLSQLELALGAMVSSRHLSFVETGRSHPSRDMVIHLAEHLDVPLRERNALLLAAGYAPVYQERSLDGDEMSPIRDALDRFLAAHEPYPAVVADGHWNLVAGNQALQLLTAEVAPELLAAPANTLRIALHPEGMAPRTLNLAEWSVHILQRLRRRAITTGDSELHRLHDELAAYPGVDAGPQRGGAEHGDIVVPLRYQTPRGVLELLSTVSVFVTAEDITLAELSIEAFYPANAQTASLLRSG